MPTRPTRALLPDGRGHGQRGFTIVEVLVAVSVLAMVAVGFAMTTGNGIELVGSSKERQTATQLASGWMEDARATPYAGLGLDDGTTFDPDPASPDAQVTAGSPPTYDAGAGPEQLVLLDGGLVHQGTDEVNGTEYDLYRYVAWVVVGAEAQAYKRVTAVVQWTGQDAGADADRVTLSTFVGADGVGWTGTTTTAPGGTTTTTTVAPTTTTTALGGCGGDVTGPSGSITILAGTGANTGYTASPSTNLQLTATDSCAPISMQFANEGGSYSTLEAFSTSKVWTLSAGNGAKTVRVRFHDGAGNVSDADADIRLDATPPTTPGSFTATVLSGPKRVRLTWTLSTDNDTLIGYRIFKKIANGGFQNIPPGVNAPCAASPCQWTDNSVQNNLTYAYYVVAYDAAGNQSAATPELTRTI